MKIVIFSGGSGSTALQKGLVQVFGQDVNYSIITNTYDNGLSTGIVREVADSNILGPSDLRKNQLLRYALNGGGAFAELLNERITLPASQVRGYISTAIAHLSTDTVTKGELLFALNRYFDCADALRVTYDDFSVANILYAGMALLEGNSLAAAGKRFAKILDLPEDAVVLNSDENLYLQAVTEHGHVILDEGDIVSWANERDKIVDVHLVTKHGNRVTPTLSDECVNVIRSADCIIFSSGTQWSSLIPTYISTRFEEEIQASKAKKYLVMNATQDKDSIGVSADEWINTLYSYLDLSKMRIICASDSADRIMQADPNNPKVISKPMCDEKGKAHDPVLLVRTIFEDYFKEALANKVFVFDYDDTLVARGNKDIFVSQDNLCRLIEKNTGERKIYICTGNSIKAISPMLVKSGIRIFADGGANLYDYGKFASGMLMSVMFNKSELNEIYTQLTAAGIAINKIQNRGDAIISVKPIDNEYRKIVATLIEMMFPVYNVKITGNTTVEIQKHGLDKTLIFNMIRDNITYFGDEVDGNDKNIATHPNTTFVPVKSVKTTNMFLRIL